VKIEGLVLLPLLLLAHAAQRVLGVGESASAFEASPHARAKSTSAPWSAVHRTALPMFALALGYYVLFSTPYFHVIFNKVSKECSWQLIAGAAVSLLVAVAARPSIAGRVRPWFADATILSVAGAAVVALAIYAYWIRPGDGATAKEILLWPGYSID